MLLGAVVLLLAYHPAPPGTFVGAPQLGVQRWARTPAVVAVDSAPAGDEFEVTISRPLGIQLMQKVRAGPRAAVDGAAVAACTLRLPPTFVPALHPAGVLARLLALPCSFTPSRAT